MPSHITDSPHAVEHRRHPSGRCAFLYILILMQHFLPRVHRSPTPCIYNPGLLTRRQLGDFLPSLARSIGIGFDFRALSILVAALLIIGPLTAFNEMQVARFLAGGGVIAVIFTAAVCITS